MASPNKLVEIMSEQKMKTENRKILRVWIVCLQGLVLKVEPHQQRVPRSQRGGEVIEPLVSSQWFVKTGDMGAKALEAVRNKDVQILPARYGRTFFPQVES